MCRPAVPPLMLLALAFVAGGCAQERTFTPLFNGVDLEGWESVGGEATYHVEDGAIVGVCKNTQKNTFLRTARTYGDFEFRCQFKWDAHGNSGIQYRSHQYPDDHKYPGGVYGYQFELDPSSRAWSGGLYEEGRRGWLVNLEGDDDASIRKRSAVKLDGWNDIVIECKGNRVRTWLNGVPIVDYTDTDAERALTEGFIALQVHSGGSAQLRWRNLQIAEIRED